MDIKGRLSEPSTWAGVSTILVALNQMFNLHGVPQVAQIADTVGDVLSSGGSWGAVAGAVITSLLAIFLPEINKEVQK